MEIDSINDSSSAYDGYEAECSEAGMLPCDAAIATKASEVLLEMAKQPRQLPITASNGKSFMTISTHPQAANIHGMKLYCQLNVLQNQKKVEIAEVPLKEQFKTGVLQQTIQRKKIDPNTLIHRAILENAYEVLVFLIKHHIDIDYQDANGMSPLTIAILSRQPKIVKLLLDNGANVEPEKKWNNTSLLEICMTAHDLETIGYLIQFGADVNAKFTNGQSPLEVARIDCIQRRNFKMASILLDSNHVDVSEMNKALQNTRTRDVRHDERGELIAFLIKLIQKGADVNADNGITLIEACCDQDVEKVKILIDHRANPNVFIKNIPPAIIKPNQPHKNIAPAIIEAAKNLEILKMLINAKANPNEIFEQQYLGILGPNEVYIEQTNPLINAITLGYADDALQRVKLLVEAGADIHTKINGKSPLEHAFNCGRMDVVQYLLLRDGSM